MISMFTQAGLPNGGRSPDWSSLRFRIGQFTFCVATDPHIQIALHRLRYKVYVEEYGFEKPEDHLNGLERDSYDPYSIPLAALDRFGRAVGSLRIIRPSERGLPALDLADPAEKRCLEGKCPVEFSRFAVSKDFRGASLDPVQDWVNYYEGFGDVPKTHGDAPFAGPSDRVVVTLGLLQLGALVSERLEATHFVMTSEKSLHVFLRRNGTRWRQIGPETEYHGRRSSHVISLQDGMSVMGNYRGKILNDFMATQNTLFLKRLKGVLHSVSFDLGPFWFYVAAGESDLEEMGSLRQASPSTPSPVREAFDLNSVHVISKEGEAIVGSLRLVLHSPLGFPSLEMLTDSERSVLEGSKKVAEISPLFLEESHQSSLSAHWRGISSQRIAGGSPLRQSSRRSTAILLLGLFRAAFRISKEFRITQWLVRLDREIVGRLADLGITASPLGSFDDRGRRPYLIRLRWMEPLMFDTGAIKTILGDMVRSERNIEFLKADSRGAAFPSRVG